MKNNPNSRFIFQLAKILSGPVLAAIVMVFPAPEILGVEGMRGLAVVAWILIWWMTQALPIPLVSLLAIPLCILWGASSVPKAIGCLGSPIMLIMFGAMFILGAMKESRLIERYIYSITISPWIRNSPTRLLIIFGFSTGILSSIMPNIPVSILFTSVAVVLASSMGTPKGSGLPRAMIVCSGAGANLGGCGTPVGGVPNLLVMGIVASTIQYDVQFWEWSAIGFPITLLWTAAMLMVCWIMFVRDCSRDNTCLVFTGIRQKLESLGPMSRREKLSLGVLVLALILWSFGQVICRSLGLPDLAKMMTTPFISIFAGCILFLLPLNVTDGKINFTLSWQDGLKSINWDIIIFIAGALLLGQVMADCQIDKWIGQLVSHVLTGLPPHLVWLALIAFTASLAQIINPVALITLFVPMSAAVASQNGLDPLTVAMTVGMVTNVSIMFPFSSPPMAAALLGSDGYAAPNDFFKVSLPLIVLCVLVVWGMGALLGPAVFAN